MYLGVKITDCGENKLLNFGVQERAKNARMGFSARGGM